MKNALKIGRIIISTISVIIFIFVIGGIIYLRIVFPPPFTKEKMVEDFNKNKVVIEYIAQYMEHCEYDFMAVADWSIDKGIMIKNPIKGAERIQVDKELLEKLSFLFIKAKYNAVQKDKNGIFFSRYSNLKFEQGVAYSLDGEPPKCDLLRKLEPIGENWYFYEAE